MGGRPYGHATIAEFRGWANVAAIQVEYSLLQRTVEGELFGIAKELGLDITPWSPLASGVLSGKYSRENQSPEVSGRASLSVAHMNEHTIQILDSLQDMGKELNASFAAITLAWVRQQSPITSTIIGVCNLDQLNSNLTSLDVTTTDEQLATLDEPDKRSCAGPPLYFLLCATS